MGKLDHKKMLKNLLPLGKAYIGENLDRLIEAISTEFSRVDELAIQLFTKEIPGSLSLKMNAWEEILTTSNTRRSSQDQRSENLSLIGKLSAVGGQSKEYWLNYLKRISRSDIKLEFYDPMSAGFSAGDLLFDKSWSFAFKIKGILPEDLEVIKENVEEFKQAHIAVIYEKRKED